MTGRANGKGPPLWFVGLLLVFSVFALLVLLNSLLASASASWVPATLFEFRDRDPADFQPVLGDGSNSLPGFESREAEDLAVSSEIDEQKEEKDDQEVREAEGLAVSSEIDEQKEEKDDQEVREAEGLAVSSVTDSQQEELDDDSTDFISLTPSYFIGLSDDVSAIRSILETPSSEPMEVQEVGQDDENIDSVDPADGSSVSSSASSDESSSAPQEEPATLDTIHSDLTILLFTLWGFAGLFLAFKVGGAVLGRL